MQNIRAVEKVDDAVQYEKLSENRRIDVFDAAVFAVARLLIDTDRASAGSGWFEDENGTPVEGETTGGGRRPGWRTRS